jgi:hypothetical protein
VTSVAEINNCGGSQAAALSARVELVNTPSPNPVLMRIHRLVDPTTPQGPAGGSEA